MKTLLFIGAFLLLQLTAVDTLLQTHPDSALTLLLDEPLDDPYYQLLLSEALYKNDYAQANHPELLKAMNYFDSIQDPFLSARCHYMNGIGYYEMDSIVPACAEYMKALDIMETHFKEKDLVGDKARFLALTYTHLCQLFSDQYLHEQAIYFGKCALPYYNKYDAEPWHLAWVLDEIGSQYAMVDFSDSANYYFNKAMTILPDTNSITYRDILAVQAFLGFINDSCLPNPIGQLYQLLSESESEREMVSRYLLIGEYYYNKACWDSAWYYLNKVFVGIDNTDAKVLSAQYLRDICIKTNDSLALNVYTIFLSEHANTNDLQASLHSQLATLIHGFEKAREERIYDQQRGKMVKKSSLIIASLLIATILLIVFVHHNKKRQLEEERRFHKTQQTALGERLKKTNEALKKERAAKIEVLPTSEKNRDYAIKFEEEPICQHILSVCNDNVNKIKTNVPVFAYASIALTPAQEALLKEAAFFHYGSLFEKLRVYHPCLKNKDLVYCYLCLLGLDNSQIAAMTQCSYRTIWEREKRLQRIFNTDDKISMFLLGFLMS